MSALAPSQYRAQTAAEMAVPQITGEDLQKLQEIHELINLLLEQLPAVPQAPPAHSYPMPVAQSAPYMYALFQTPWGRVPFVPSNGI